MLVIVICILVATSLMGSNSQPQQAAAGGAGGGPPPGRGFQLKCTDEYAYEDDVCPALLQEFVDNAPPGYEVVAVEPCIYPGKNAHRFLVKYRSRGPRRCEEINLVRDHMNDYKPQNSNVGSIAVVPGGYMVEYKRYCRCYRRAFRRRRSVNNNTIRSWNDAFKFGYYISPPEQGPDGNTMRCDDRDKSCGYQNF